MLIFRAVQRTKRKKRKKRKKRLLRYDPIQAEILFTNKIMPVTHIDNSHMYNKMYIDDGCVRFSGKRDGKAEDSVSAGEVACPWGG